MHNAPRPPSTTVSEISVVMVGSFTPTIFQPAWFAAEDLLRKVEAEDAKKVVVHEEITQFSTEWLSLEVTRDRFVARLKSDAYLRHLSDFLQGVISTLIHTPIQQFGTNVEVLARFGSSEDWHAFGHFLAPKSPWKVTDLDTPGMRSINMQYERAQGAEAGCTVVGVQPVLNTRTDVLFRINDHYDSDGSDNARGGKWALSLMKNQFDESIARSDRLVTQILSNFTSTDFVDSGDIK